ncbi:MAG: twin-arginine translocase TatA/TatE family subunit [Solirubrobacteraceae bacterium]
MIGDILQPTHLIFILLVALIFLGPKRLPEAGRALGKGIRDFKGAVAGIAEDASFELPTPPAVSQAPSAPAPVVTPVVAAQPVGTTVNAEPAATNVTRTPTSQSYPPTLTLTSSVAPAEPVPPTTAWVEVESTNPTE